MAGGGSFVLCGALFSRWISGLEIESKLSTPRDSGSARHAYRASQTRRRVTRVYRRRADRWIPVKERRLTARFPPEPVQAGQWLRCCVWPHVSRELRWGQLGEAKVSMCRPVDVKLHNRGEVHAVARNPSPSGPLIVIRTATSTEGPPSHNQGVKNARNVQDFGCGGPVGGLCFLNGRCPGHCRPNRWHEQRPGSGSRQPSRLRARGARLASP
jgi:hypothetical protein